MAAGTQSRPLPIQTLSMAAGRMAHQSKPLTFSSEDLMYSIYHYSTGCELHAVHHHAGASVFTEVAALAAAMSTPLVLRIVEWLTSLHTHPRQSEWLVLPDGRRTCYFAYPTNARPPALPNPRLFLPNPAITTFH